MFAACCQITSTASVSRNLAICRNVSLRNSPIPNLLANPSCRCSRSEGNPPPSPRTSPIKTDRLEQVIFLPEASDFIVSSGAESVKVTQELGSIDKNYFIKGLQAGAIEFNVSVTAGVHLPTDSPSHVCAVSRLYVESVVYSALTRRYGLPPQGP